VATGKSSKGGGYKRCAYVEADAVSVKHARGRLRRRTTRAGSIYQSFRGIVTRKRRKAEGRKQKAVGGMQAKQEGSRVLNDRLPSPFCLLLSAYFLLTGFASTTLRAK
jgi:hypothetical protein